VKEFFSAAHAIRGLSHLYQHFSGISGRLIREKGLE
jgi:hypothetical protein